MSTKDSSPEPITVKHKHHVVKIYPPQTTVVEHENHGSRVTTKEYYETCFFPPRSCTIINGAEEDAEPLMIKHKHQLIKIYPKQTVVVAPKNRVWKVVSKECREICSFLPDPSHITPHDQEEEGGGDQESELESDVGGVVGEEEKPHNSQFWRDFWQKKIEAAEAAREVPDDEYRRRRNEQLAAQFGATAFFVDDQR